MQKYNSEEISEIAKALINVQRQLQPATKNANNPFTKAWRNELIKTCSDGADEELFCIPRASSGSYLTTAMIRACWVGHEPHSRGVGAMAGEPCRGSSAQGRSPRNGHIDDLYAPLCAFSYAWHRHGGRYGRGVQLRQT